MTCMARISRVHRKDNTSFSYYFHRVTMTVVPSPGVVWISKSFISRLLPPSPRPIPCFDVNPSERASFTSAIPGPLSEKVEPDAFADSIDCLRDLKCATTTVFKSIATQFTGGRDNLGLIHKTKFQVDCPDTDPLPHENHIRGISDRELFRFIHYPRHIPHCFRRPSSSAAGTASLIQR